MFWLSRWSRLRSSSSRRGGISPEQILQIEHDRRQLSALLKDLPSDLDLHRLDGAEFARLLGPRSPASRLYVHLREAVGLGKVATSKLLARKRPRLIPIRDSATTDALGKQEEWWEPWWHALTDDDRAVKRLRSLRSEAGTRRLSLLRTADIAIWMRPTVEPERGDGRRGSKSNRRPPASGQEQVPIGGQRILPRDGRSAWRILRCGRS